MKYSIGVDFGTLSGRAVLVRVDTGEIVAQSVFDYINGVIDEKLPIEGKPIHLEPEWALQDPWDYVLVFQKTIPAVLKQAQVSADDVIGIGIDFTACTMLPVAQDGTALCMLPEYRHNPHAWVKLWKHHAAQPEADYINETAEKMGESWLPRYGGKISSEWFMAKTLQILNEAPEIYAATDTFIEAADWVIWQLTGQKTRNTCTAGYKAIWSKREGYPDKSFFAALHPQFENLITEKMSGPILPIGNKAGGLTAQAAAWTNLNPGTAVAIANVDAHVSAPAAKVTEPGRMLLIMGTSTCNILIGTQEHNVPGMCGYVEDGVLPGYIGYEAGQSCVGDHFAWFVETCTPLEYYNEASAKGISIHQLMTEKAELLKIGESGLLVLDWWNGNRSVLVDTNLSGLMIGATLSTKPEEIYRALIEATAYGQRMITETFENNGVPINELVACGGLPEKNPMLMQIYADVIGKTIWVSATNQTPALGSAMFGAVAAGKAAGGYETIFDASEKMAHLRETPYLPNPENQATYELLYQEYAKLHDYFGRGENNVMKKLKQIRAKAKGI
ncbi:MAG: ribulokinase [Chloroflexi bacterium HGW-Chloroflexi-10]|nr:MAG: ribulokinase [Chloroflexi bacterium HGW-Chloroflexi-10]